jgi:hypothetical protein
MNILVETMKHTGGHYCRQQCISNRYSHVIRPWSSTKPLLNRAEKDFGCNVAAILSKMIFFIKYLYKKQEKLKPGASSPGANQYGDRWTNGPTDGRRLL